ncbi:hypothetical protein [Spiroplasma endosymbiont of Cleonymus obscurus]|uniref:hypothetical protein n=1 Tax=Spiroplasma endosymbiont of Cleonymus obscurus TaxID=3066324 RepID=UPI0037DD9AF5
MSKLIFKKETHQYFLEDKELISVSRIIDNYLGFGYSHIAPEVLKNASNRDKDEDKLKRIKLQLTAYYCMLLDNGIIPSYKTYVYLTNKNTQQEIKIEITNELINEWLEAKINYFKGENKND